MINSKYFRKFAQTLTATTFFVPLVVMPSSFIFPFIVPKVVVFRSLVVLMLASYILLLASNWERYKPKVSWLHIGVFLFISSFILSTIFSVDPYRSFWDNHERMLGLFSVLHYVLFYYIVSAIFTKWRDWKWIMRIFLGAGTIVMLVAFWQKFIDPSAVLNQGASGVHSTLGNPIYVGGYGAFLFFLGLLLFFKEKKSDHKYWRYFSLFGSFMGLFGIYAASQRGPFVGLVAGVAVAFYLYSWFYKHKKHVKKTAIVVTIVGLALVGGIVYYRNTPFVKNIPIVGDLANVRFDKGSVETRLLAWNSAYQAWKDHPVFGWGVRNYYYAFNQYFPPKMLEHGYGETWFDNAHNILMNTLATRGVVGILTYLFLFVSVILALSRGYKKGKINKPELILSVSFVASHFVHNVFVFEDPTSYLYFFFLLAYIQQRSEGDVEEQAKAQSYSRDVSYGLSAVVFGIALLVVYSTNINVAKANTASLETLRVVKSARKNTITKMEKTFSMPSPHQDVITTDVANAAIQVLPKYIEAGNKKSAKAIFETVYPQLDEVRKLHPREIRVNMKQARLAMIGARLYRDVKYVQQAEQFLETALKYSPGRQQLQYMLANMKYNLKKHEEAIKILKKAKNNNPNITDSWWRLAHMYVQTGQKRKGRNTIIRAKRSGIEFKGQGKNVLKRVGLNPEKIKASDEIITSSKKVELKANLKKQILEQQSQDKTE